MLSPVCRPHGLGSRMQIVSAFKSVEVFSFLVQSKYETRVIECRVLSRHRLNPSKTSSFLHPFPHPPLCISNLFPPRYARPVSLLQFSNIIIHLHASPRLPWLLPTLKSRRFAQIQERGRESQRLFRDNRLEVRFASC